MLRWGNDGKIGFAGGLHRQLYAVKVIMSPQKKTAGLVQPAVFRNRVSELRALTTLRRVGGKVPKIKESAGIHKYSVAEATGIGKAR